MTRVVFTLLYADGSSDQFKAEDRDAVVVSVWTKEALEKLPHANAFIRAGRSARAKAGDVYGITWAHGSDVESGMKSDTTYYSGPDSLPFEKHLRVEIRKVEKVGKTRTIKMF